MNKVNLSKNKFEFVLDEAQYKIFSQEGLVESGTMEIDGKSEEEISEMASEHFEDFIAGHTIETFEHDGIVKRVAFDKERKDYIQLQAIKTGEADYYIVQEYNSDLAFLREYETDVWYCDEIEKYMLKKYDLQRGLTSYVFKFELGDCTNGGISSERRELYILGCETSPFYAKDLRDCVQIVKREVIGEQYVNAKPIVHPKRWYMAGGNFLYTSDSRYKEATGVSYPISIHDRCEGE